MRYFIPLCMAAMLAAGSAGAQTMRDDAMGVTDEQVGSQVECPAIPSFASLDDDDDGRVSSEEFDVLLDDTQNTSLFSDIDDDDSAGISEAELDSYRTTRGCP